LQALGRTLKLEVTYPTGTFSVSYDISGACVVHACGVARHATLQRRVQAGRGTHTPPITLSHLHAIPPLALQP